jgi:hypothetical protein
MIPFEPDLGDEWGVGRQREQVFQVTTAEQGEGTADFLCGLCVMGGHSGKFKNITMEYLQCHDMQGKS